MLSGTGSNRGTKCIPRLARFISSISANRLSRNPDLDFSEKQKERARWDLDYAVSRIDAWKAHLLRTSQQDQARQDTLDRLDDQTIRVINDWTVRNRIEKRRPNGSTSAELAGTFLLLFTQVNTQSTHMWLPLTAANRTGFPFLVYLKMSLSVSKNHINQYVERS